jgi:hypothetical protein
LRQHDHIEEVRAKIASRVDAGDYSPYQEDYSVGGLEGVPKYFKDYSNVLTFGHTGNLAVTFLGSYNLDYSVVSIDQDAGTALVGFHVYNESTLASATHPPVLGYTPFWRKNIEPVVNNLVLTGPMSKVMQDFRWTEIIHFKHK